MKVRSSCPPSGGARLGVLLGVLLAVPQLAGAAVITVDNPVIGTGADGLCDLVEAIENANDGAATNPECAAGEAGVDVIELTVDITLDGVYEESSQSRGPIGLPRVVTPIVIQSDSSSSPQGEVIRRTIERDGGSADDFRFFFVGVGGDLTLNDVVLEGGLVQDIEDSLAVGSNGGAIFNLDALTLSNTTISGNAVSADAGVSPDVLPYAYGGGIFNLGSLTVSDSTISDNSVYATDASFAYAAGGGIASGAFAYSELPTLSLTYSTISGNVGNSVSTYAVTYGGGLNASYGTATITNSTISGNSSEGYGTASTDADGGGVEVVDADVTLTHSTVAANSKVEGGAGVDAYGAGVDVIGVGSASLYGSLVAHQVGDNCFGVTDGGDNLADDDTCGTIPDTLEGLDPILAGNGGPTRTHRMTSTSNARDLGGVCGLDDDQRGVSRLIDNLCDTGSYEFFCNAPDEDVVLADDLLLIERTVEACGMITGGPSYEIGDGGNLIARAGSKVVLVNGFEVAVGGRMSVELDPSIQMPDSAASEGSASTALVSGGLP